jgi:ribosomal protein L44E
LIPDFGKIKGASEFLKRSFARFGIEMDLGAAIAAIAATIRDHGHFGRLITKVDPSFRQTFYDAVRPNLTFVAWPLDRYIIAAQQTAEREQLPTLMADGTLQAYQVPTAITDEAKFAENLMAKSLAKRALTVKCSKCGVEETFYGLDGDTKAAILMKVRKAGWVYTPVVETETCPNCVVIVAN